MDGKCKSCHARDIVNKKRGLCSTCYQRERNAGSCKPERSSPMTLKKYENLNEIEFIKNYFTHKQRVYHPANFHLGDCSYEPDFYDGMANCFIEVSGTRQAYHANKDKYKQFRKTFPWFALEIRAPSGELIEENGRMNWLND